MMHVLILPMYYPEPDAPPHRGYMFREQAMQLIAAGCRVGLAYVEQRLLHTMSLQTLRESHFQVSQEESDGLVTLRMHAWNPKLSTRLGGQIWAHLALHLVGIYIRRFGKPDIIHAHFATWAGYAAHLAWKRYGIPYVVTEHASSINAEQVTPEQAATLRAAYADARRVICVGSLLKQNLTPYLRTPEQAVVIPNFVDLRTFAFTQRHTDKAQQFALVSVGNLTKRKGFDELLEAFALAFRNRPQVSLTIAGDGEEYGHLQQRIHELGLESQVTLTGRLPREGVARLLAESDAFVLASHAETFGIVFIEALATGMPAVGTICGGPEDIITPQCGYLVRPGQREALVHAMTDLYDHYEQFDPVSIRQAVESRFDFRLAGQRFMEVYASCLDNPSPDILKFSTGHQPHTQNPH